jgi:hypothetical protein
MIPGDIMKELNPLLKHIVVTGLVFFGLLPIKNTLNAQQARLVMPAAHYYGVEKLCVSPDSALLASSDINGNLIVWNRTNESELFRTRFSHTILSLCFVSPTQLIAGMEDSISFIDLESGQQLFSPCESGIIKMQFSARKLYNLSRDSVLRSSVISPKGRLGETISHASGVTDFDLQNDRLTMVGRNRVIRKNLVSGLDFENELPYFNSAPTLVRSWKNDSVFILGFKDGYLLKWNSFTLKSDTIHKFDNSVNQIICDTTLNQIYACSNDFLVLRYELKSGREQVQFQSDYCTDMLMTNNKIYVSCYDGNIYIYNKQLVHLASLRSKIEKAVNYKILHNGQAAIAYECGDVYILNYNDSTRRLLIKTGKRVSAIAEDPETNVLYISCYDSTLYRCHPMGAEFPVTMRFGSPLVSLAYEPNNKKLLVVLLDSLILIDRYFQRLYAIHARSPWFVNRSGDNFYVGGYNCIYYVDCGDNSMGYITYKGLNYKDPFVVECIKSTFGPNLYYINYSGELWKLAGDSHTLLIDVKQDLHHVFQSNTDKYVYLVSGDNKVYQIDPEKPGEVRVVYSDTTLEVDETWSIDQNKKGEFLISTGTRLLVFSPDWTKIVWSFDMKDRVCLAPDSRRSATFINGSDTIFAIAYDGSCFWGYINNSDQYPRNFMNGVTHKKIATTLKISFDSAIYRNFTYELYHNGAHIISFLDLESGQWLVYDKNYRFDGSESAINRLYLTCGLEEIELNHIKDSLWTPGLAQLYYNGLAIRINDKPAPCLQNLNICQLTPLVHRDKSIEGDSLFVFRITPRNGGLGITEVYINDNLTFQYKPTQLEERIENNRKIYYLKLNSDSLQIYLTGRSNTSNPLVVKSKASGSGIYGRGENISLYRKVDTTPMPRFFGVFIGVNEYGNPNKNQDPVYYTNLDYAEKDALNLASATESAAKHLFGDQCYIYRLTGTGANAPTRENLTRTLAEIGEKASAADVLYIFFAGHGDVIESDGERQIRFMLSQADKRNKKSGSFGVEELNLWCSPRNIHAQKRVFIFDACHSGKIIDEISDKINRGDYNADRIRQLDKLKDKNGMIILAASAENQFAYEDPSLDQGVLTYHLLQAVKQQKGDSLLIIKNWFDEAISMLESYCINNNQRQEPQSFGDGRFYIGIINQQVRGSIVISEPKVKVGTCIFTDPSGDAEIIYPGLEKQINKIFSTSAGRGNWVNSKSDDNAYHVVGTYLLSGKKLIFRYRIYYGNTQIGESITLILPSKQKETELVEILTESIYTEVQKKSQSP